MIIEFNNKKYKFSDGEVFERCSQDKYWIKLQKANTTRNYIIGTDPAKIVID